MRTVVLVAAFALTAACGGPAATSAAQESPPPPDPVQVCVNQLTYWAGEQLRGAPDEGYDYQHMGLTGEQNDALRAIVERARAAGPGVVEGMSRDACTRIAARPTSGPWGY